MKILVYADLQEQYRDELLSRLPSDAEIILKENLPDTDLEDAIASADILIGNPPAEMLGKAPLNLKFWQLENVGFEQYKDVEFHGTVANVGDMSAASCAETIVAGVLAFYRGVHLMVRNQLEKKWVKGNMDQELSILGEQQVIVLGSGAIGQHVRKLLEAFGCRVRMTAKSDPTADIHTFEELLDNLPETDLVINTLPGNLDKYVSADFFAAIREGAVYANVGRGNTTDEADLISALKSGKLSGAILDVTAEEPLPEENALWDFPNVILTQHSGAAHQGRDRDKVNKFAENVEKFLKGEKLEDEVKLSDGY